MGGVGVMVMSVMFGGKTMCMGDNLKTHYTNYNLLQICENTTTTSSSL